MTPPHARAESVIPLREYRLRYRVPNNPPMRVRQQDGGTSKCLPYGEMQPEPIEEPALRSLARQILQFDQLENITLLEFRIPTCTAFGRIGIVPDVQAHWPQR